MNDFQLYPTPKNIAARAWAKFKDRDFVRVLEPSAGRGDLIKGHKYYDEHRGCSFPIDCCEIDFHHHATLREMPKVQLVGMDFLEFGGGGIYSHIIQNPPFAQGVQHTLKAWDCLFDGEVVSIINAETLRNPFSKERQHLVRLIEMHGDVEFVEDAFKGEGVDREADVTIAIVHLIKKSGVGESIVDGLTADLAKENEQGSVDGFSQGFRQSHELALPTGVIENFVHVFNAAVEAMREAVIAQARANHCQARIGKPMNELTQGPGPTKAQESAVEVRTLEHWVKIEMSSGYASLKDRAWANLLRSSNVQSKLSSNGQKRIEAAFAEIKTLEFTLANVLGFLRGLTENQAKIMQEMACDVFDIVVRFHTDNVEFYKGWKSNSKHRTFGMRLKKTRFVIPNNNVWKGSSSLEYNATRRLDDLDRVFSMLDGKDQPLVSLRTIFERQMPDLEQGERLSGSYFDVRYYPKSGTIHFFPRSEALMDRLNLMVGHFRQWLPSDMGSASKDFVAQYEGSGRFDKAMREDLGQSLGHPNPAQRKSLVERTLGEAMRNDCSEDRLALIDASLTSVHEKNGIAGDPALSYKDQSAMPIAQQPMHITEVLQLSHDVLSAPDFEPVDQGSKDSMQDSFAFES